MQYIGLGSLSLSQAQAAVLLLMYFSWLVVAIFTGKFRLQSYADYRTALVTLAKAGAFTAYVVVAIVVFGGMPRVSLLVLFGSILLLVNLEILAFTAVYWKGLRRKWQGSTTLRAASVRLSVPLIACDFALLTGAFFVVDHFLTGHSVFALSCQKVLLLFYGVWLPASLLTRKFARQKQANIYHAIIPAIKAAVFMGLCLSIAVSILHIVDMAPPAIFATLTLLVLSEVAVFGAVHALSAHPAQISDIETVDAVESYLRNDQLELEFPVADAKTDYVLSAKTTLENQYLTANPELFYFINDNLKLDEVDTARMVVFNSNNLNHLREIDVDSLKMFINLKRINDVRWVNQYFLEVYKKLSGGGTLVGICDTIDIQKKRLFRTYPRRVAVVMQVLHFLYARVWPKLPYLKRIYFIVSRGKNRALSKAELLGRLYFCGYRVLALDETDEHFYFIAQKVKTPSTNKNPSYGPIIKMKRIGLHGKPIYINKLRTMHPYAENLQEYVYEQNRLQANGKFRNDFRVTGWAKALRKLWIDELPQLINYFQGDLNLVGVRALSQQYFQMYPKDLQRLRVKFKPGLIPPYYYDLPTSFEEIVESERRYLTQKMQRPLYTDLKYLSVALFNILFKGARSK